MPACYTPSYQPAITSLGREIGQCETRITTSYVNKVPQAVAYAFADPTTGTLFENQYYATLKGMNSTKFNAQKSLISDVYRISLMFATDAADAAQSLRYQSIAAQIACWIKESKAYDEGNLLDWVRTVVDAYAGLDGAISVLSTLTTANNLASYWATFNATLQTAHSHTCVDLAPLVVTDPGPLAV